MNIEDLTEDQIRELKGRKIRRVVWISYMEEDMTAEQAQDVVTNLWDYMPNTWGDRVYRLKPICEEVITVGQIDNPSEREHVIDCLSGDDEED